MLPTPPAPPVNSPNLPPSTMIAFPVSDKSVSLPLAIIAPLITEPCTGPTTSNGSVVIAALAEANEVYIF